MGRPRGFDEDEVVRTAAALFAERAYDGVSVDDLVSHLGVHRNSLYKTFGSKRGLYLRALRRHVDEDVRPLADALAEAGGPMQASHLVAEAELDLLLLAAVERAPSDTEVAALVGEALEVLDLALGAVLPGSDTPKVSAFTAALLGLRLRARATGSPTDSDTTALAQRFETR
ncbi:TetR/AcrR family transcriptional regulator [Amycolatopsis rhizosphaerae]|uniref:TetR/AcrR family transcriptional regulator n=1 Tax=Amycolatopsis rhizosphaerae TaxID=2053003 RepID=A0A558DKQ9_9PSEU|nr:TetR/AcrR family transcriptional regulator [Amycolatopsis rhizosphaerae]TVT61597.1 TetR/AcrR family transcriptional regulator [Amycolatopsis rhizosphaerae]